MSRANRRVRGRTMLIAAAALGTARAAAAQPSVHVFIQAEGGLGYGAGGDHTNRAGFALDAVIGGVTSRRSRVLAIAVGAHGPLGGQGDECELTPQGTCRQPFPLFFSLGALVGRAWGRSGPLSAMAVVGPSVHHEDDGGSAIGVSARVEGGVTLWGPLALTLAIKSTVLPNYRGDALALSAFGIGLSVRP